MPRVVIMVGASGSGKSTWIKHNAPGAVVCSADHYFSQPDGSYRFDGNKLGAAHAACFSHFRQALAAKEELVVVDNTSTRALERKEYIDTATRQGYEVWLSVLKPDPEVSAARNTHGVPPEAVRKMHERIDVPEGYYQIF